MELGDIQQSLTRWSCLCFLLNGIFLYLPLLRKSELKGVGQELWKVPHFGRSRLNTLDLLLFCACERATEGAGSSGRPSPTHESIGDLEAGKPWVQGSSG